MYSYPIDNILSHIERAVEGTGHMKKPYSERSEHTNKLSGPCTLLVAVARRQKRPYLPSLCRIVASCRAATNRSEYSAKGGAICKNETKENCDTVESRALTAVLYSCSRSTSRPNGSVKYEIVSPPRVAGKTRDISRRHRAESINRLELNRQPRGRVRFFPDDKTIAIVSRYPRDANERDSLISLLSLASEVTSAIASEHASDKDELTPSLVHFAGRR